MNYSNELYQKMLEEVNFNLNSGKTLSFCICEADSCFGIAIKRVDNNDIFTFEGYAEDFYCDKINSIAQLKFHELALLLDPHDF